MSDTVVPRRPHGANGQAHRFARIFDRAAAALCSVATVLAAAGLLVSLGVIVWAVVMRYAVGQPVLWADELVGYLLVAIVMLSSAEALRHDEHICVDILTERLGERARRTVAVFGLATVLLTALLLVWQGWLSADFTRTLGILSPGHMAMPMWLPQMLVPLGGAVLSVAALAGLVRMAAGLPQSVSASGGHGSGGGGS